MTQMWDKNEEKNAEEELVITEHRDSDVASVTPEQEPQTATTADDPREALEELGEDVSSSPARRAHEEG